MFAIYERASLDFDALFVHACIASAKRRAKDIETSTLIDPRFKVPYASRNAQKIDKLILVLF